MTALNDIHMKIYLTTAMVTMLVTVCAIGVWILSADHLAAAVARNKIREARLTKALWEEAEARDKQRYARVRYESTAQDHN
ncbi:hypothetical protein [Streptosporangium sp. CA-115845]|uniref:hypothetical protein n=1 Tax=Streptosporangium sp. CA-115845 TaxID=3240071 RepID=UPI003D938031